MANKGKIAGFVKNKNKTIFNTQLDSWIYTKVLILIFQNMGKFRSKSTLKSGFTLYNNSKAGFTQRNFGRRNIETFTFFRRNVEM